MTYVLDKSCRNRTSWGDEMQTAYLYYKVRNRCRETRICNGFVQKVENQKDDRKMEGRCKLL